MNYWECENLNCEGGVVATFEILFGGCTLCPAGQAWEEAFEAVAADGAVSES